MLQTYSDGHMFLDGQLLAESINFSVEHDSGNHEIVTQGKGFAGISPGAKKTKGTINSAVPRAGIEYSYIDSLQSDAIVEFVFYRAGKKVKFKGYIMNCKEQYGADKPSDFSADFVGSPAEETVL